MQTEPRSLGASICWHILLPRGAALLFWAGANQMLQMPAALTWGLITADALFLIWTIRSHLHAADSHMRGSGAMAPIWGGYLILLFSILASLLLWWQALLISYRPAAGPSYADIRAQQHAARYSLALSSDGTAIVFDGEITFGLTKALKALMLRHPEVRRIGLSSPGGHIYEARGVAKLVQAQEVSTQALGLCASACTLIFAAGTQRVLAPQAQLGFHGYSLDVFGGLPQIDLTAEQEKDRRFLISQGISDDFINQVYATAPTELWRPSPDVLRRAGVLTTPR
ncbi:ATP-dependent Clp protease proteolytic subunit [Pseudophaeobacter sp.]|uniref:ATP-dependent Clp protease proteolytic subunit n=1 Tax=Pseudophaeobacter sp. TaxID=1971739 RepID=UPI003A97462E